MESINDSASEAEWNFTKAGIYLTTPKVAKFYNMNHESKGLALIFNHSKWDSKPILGGKRVPYTPRKSSEKDAETLKKCLYRLGFKQDDVKIHNNCTLSKITKLLNKVSRLDHTKRDCLIICIMTHGENGKLVDSEGTCYHLDKLWKCFTPEKCPSLVGKPKIFLVQACRGNNSNGAFLDIRQDGNLLPPSFSYTVPSMADFLIAFSTSEDAIAWRCPLNGSWFIQSFCQILCKYPKEDLLSLLTIVARQVATKYAACQCGKKCLPQDIHKCAQSAKQVPQFLSTLMRKVQFQQLQEGKKIEIADVVFEDYSIEDPPVLEGKAMPVAKDAEYYNMKHNNRGVALIFYCHEWGKESEKSGLDNLPGYINDQYNLSSQLGKLSFDVRKYENPTLSEIDETLEKVSKEDHTHNDALLVAVMTHGIQGDLVDSEGASFAVERLWHLFRTENCKTLNGKPKIFVIQACRGTNDDLGTSLPKESESKPESQSQAMSELGSFTYTLPLDSDFLFVYSTVEGFTSVTMTKAGSPFIQSICKSLSKCYSYSAATPVGAPRDFLSLITEASMNTGLATSCACPTTCPLDVRDTTCKSRIRQIPQIVSTLIRKIVFEPKTSDSI